MTRKWTLNRWAWRRPPSPGNMSWEAGFRPGAGSGSRPSFGGRVVRLLVTPSAEQAESPGHSFGVSDLRVIAIGFLCFLSSKSGQRRISEVPWDGVGQAGSNGGYVARFLFRNKNICIFAIFGVSPGAVLLWAGAGLAERGLATCRQLEGGAGKAKAHRTVA